MQHVFHLHADQGERCKPEHYVCTQKFKCLRYRAEPDRGIPLADHSSLLDDCNKSLPLVGNDKAP